MDNDSKKSEEEIEKEQKIEAGKNTAHVAGRAAARYFGGEVGGQVYDRLSQTKLGQNLERRAGKVVANKPIVGNLNKKLNDSGAVDAANQAIDITDKTSKSGANNKSGTNNGLQKNKANQKRNLSSFLNKRKKDNSSNATNSGENSSNAVNNDLESDDNKEKFSIGNKAKQVKLIIMILGPVIFFVFIILVLIAIVGYIGSLFGIVSLGSSTTMSDNKNEQKYYEKLDSIVTKYQKSCGITIDKNYIHTILIYPMNNYDEFFDQEFSLEDVEDESEEFDYKSITGQIGNVAKLLVSDCSIDYDVDGSSYNRVKNSSFFKSHYKEVLKKNDADTILEDVFDLAEIGSSLNNNDKWFISDNLKVNMVPCGSGQPSTGNGNNSTISFSEYIIGVVYEELKNTNGLSASNKEFLKAQIVATISNTLSRAGYQSGDNQITVQNGDCWQNYYNTSSIPSSTLNLLNEAYDAVFGTIMVNTDGTMKEARYGDGNCGNDCMGQQNGINDAQSGMKYDEILQKYYSGFTLNNAKEDSYVTGVNYKNGGYNENVVYYNQNDYSNKFCGRSNATIASSGCGTTAMSIVLSTLVDKTYDPVTVMKEAYGMNACGSGISGTATSFFKKSAKLHDLDYKRVSKSGDLQAVLNALENGNSLVIAHMGPSTFTRGGHYIVLARVNDSGKVYVYDPNKTSRNGWYNFNSVIVKELRGSFHIITKG